MTDLLIPSWPRRGYVLPRGLPDGWRPQRTVTIITPLFQEPDMTFQRSAAAIAAMQYPGHLVQVLWLVDGSQSADAERARTAIQAAQARMVVPIREWRLVELPSVSPKGHALNQAFPLAGGDVVGIVDGDVIPHPVQLSEAVCALEDGHDLVQAHELPEPCRKLTARLRAAEDATWSASNRSVAAIAGVHVVAGSSVYAWRRTWEIAMPVLDDDVEESYDWSLTFMDSRVVTGFLRRPSRVSPTVSVAAALRQRARWGRGVFRLAYRRWPSLTPRGRLLAALGVTTWAARAALPLLAAAALFNRRVRAITACIVAAECLRIVGAAVSAEYGPETDALGWLLLLPWEAVGSVAVYRAFWELVQDDRSWHSVRDHRSGSSAVGRPAR